jgi:hypothetical protein
MLKSLVITLKSSRTTSWHLAAKQTSTLGGEPPLHRRAGWMFEYVSRHHACQIKCTLRHACMHQQLNTTTGNVTESESPAMWLAATSMRGGTRPEWHGVGLTSVSSRSFIHSTPRFARCSDFPHPFLFRLRPTELFDFPVGCYATLPN